MKWFAALCDTGRLKIFLFLFSLLIISLMSSREVFQWKIWGQICFPHPQNLRRIYRVFRKIFYKTSKIESVSVILPCTCTYFIYNWFLLTASNSNPPNAWTSWVNLLRYSWQKKHGWQFFSFVSSERFASVNSNVVK